MAETVLITGANGQLGSVLTKALQDLHGTHHVIASDLEIKSDFEGIFRILDIMDFKGLQHIVTKYGVTQIYHMAAILSAKGEQHPLHTWDVNMKTLFNVLEVARLHKVQKVFFPSSIAVFGDYLDRGNTSQFSNLIPATMYGITKASGELWAHYYVNTYGLEVRSLRYPGVIGYQSLPGGGTTDYAVDIFHKAVQGKMFECFLGPKTVLPMIYMDDAIRATIELMAAPKSSLRSRTPYNLSGMSFSPEQLAKAIRKEYPKFNIVYRPDFRQHIADSWPQSIDDTPARLEWGWQPKYNLETMTKDMIEHLKNNYLLTQLKT